MKNFDEFVNKFVKLKKFRPKCQYQMFRPKIFDSYNFNPKNDTNDDDEYDDEFAYEFVNEFVDEYDDNYDDEYDDE